MRFGVFPKLVLQEIRLNKNIWIHAVSVGEVSTVLDLIQKINDLYPGHRIICSTVTETGQKLAQSKLKDKNTVIYAPLDFSWIVLKYIQVISPVIYISTETEIWPNLYTFLHSKRVPIIQVNGRISDKAFKGYKRVRYLIKKVLECVDMFCMQSEQDADRIKRLGASVDKVRTVGNLKFDHLPVSTQERKQNFGFDQQDALFIAGSTHPGEEDIIIHVYKHLTKRFADLRLIIAPRHIERTNEIVKLIEENGFQPQKFSEIHGAKIDQNVIVVVDTIGHLRTLYCLAKVVFIGKTFTVGGGQNMIEPAFFGKATLVGPQTQNFKEVMNIFLKDKAIIQVNNSAELLAEMTDLLKNPKKIDEIGMAAKQTVEKYQGATQKTVEVISDMLKQDQ